MRTAAVCTFLHLFRLFPAGGKIGNRVNNRRGGVPAPGDAYGFYNFVRNPHFRNTLDGAGTELLRGQDGDAQTALDHVEGGGGAGGPADDAGGKARFPACIHAQLIGHLAGIVKDEGLILQRIFTDVGWNKNGVAQQFDITVPGSIHHSSGLATMGFGASAVLGGKLAAPDRICLTLTGDGGFGVNPTCLATAVEQGIACTWVVMNNSAFGTIAGLENANYGTKFGTVFKTAEGEPYSPCWADVAKAYGVDAVRVESAEEFLPAMKKAVEMNKAGKPYLVEAPMENIVVPTPGCWNINDIYSPNQYVSEGKLVEKEDGKWVAPNHAKSHKAK